MPKNHESKLYIVEVAYARIVRYFVFRTRLAARVFAKEQNAKKSVWSTRIVPAKWGPDN